MSSPAPAGTRARLRTPTMSAPSSPTGPEVTGVFRGHVVCIGASAGGLDALERFFRNCPADTGAAFVVVQHLSPDHKSMMSNLLARHTTMPVVLVTDGMTIEANRLHLIPPGSVMRVSDGVLRLSPKSPRGLTLPIDIFFNSMAQACGERSIGVILSGTGTDGTRGATAINVAGGLLMVQSPELAGFDGMPRSAIATGLVDVVLPAEELPGALVAHLRQLPAADADAPARSTTLESLADHEVVDAILLQLRQVGGIDFSDYKPATVMRRIERRQHVRHAPRLHQYLSLLERDRGEVLTLRREILISVTSFFRDPDTFAYLAEHVIAPLAAGAPGGETLRVWVAGVATGEEAYTIGMLFLEAFERERRWPNVKIFATDVDAQVIETASAGTYPESAAAELSPERLERFFTRKGDTFVVRDELRQCVVFARHNLLVDPPFTRMDLVVCRNTLIYFRPEAQERALRSLQYALKEGGALLLGSSESLSAGSDALQTLSARHKIFRRTGSPPLPYTDRRARDPGLRATDARPVPAARGRPAPSRDRAAEAGLATLLGAFAPPAILVGENHEALHYYGDVSGYFRARDGTASLDLARLLPESLTPVATTLVYKCVRERAALVSEPVTVTMTDGTRRPIRVSAHPVGGQTGERLTLLCLRAEQAQDARPAEPEEVDAGTLARLAVLERELAATRENLQSTIEELEASNEELQSTNEELMASNEELQSSNEELQSVNEEMSTINSEFQEKLVLIDRTNADLETLTKATGVASVFVDGHFDIRRFSPDATQVFRLRDVDVGRRLDEISHLLAYPDLMQDVERTLALQRPLEREVPSTDGRRTFLVRMHPYQLPSSPDKGVVATFVDVSAVHDARRLQAIIDALPEHIAVLDVTGRIVMINAAWKRFARANGDPELAHSGVGANYLDACTPGGDDGAIALAAARGLRGVLEGSLPAFSIDYPCHSATERRWFVMNAAPVVGSEFGAVVSHVDVTRRADGARP